MPVTPAKGSTVGKSLGSGFRARELAESPPSGVRSAKGEVQKATPKVAFVPQRPKIDSEAGLTQIGEPDPRLLALARGEERAEEGEKKAETGEKAGKARKARGPWWFLAGLIVGGATVWALTSDVSADVYRARLWTASTLRSIRAHATDATGTGPAAQMGAPRGIPTLDVTELPRAKDEAPQTPAPASAVAPPSPGAPALSHAPGPH